MTIGNEWLKLELKLRNDTEECDTYLREQDEEEGYSLSQPDRANITKMA